MRVLIRVGAIARHPAFWVPLLLALGADAFFFYGFLLPTKAIGGDGWGYYIYLPAIFIFGDPHLTFMKSATLPPEILQYRFADGSFPGLSAHGDGFIDKYAFGPAMLQLPFFLVAWVFSKFSYARINGFERPFQAANMLAGAFYFALGCYLSYRAARLRYDRLACGIGLAAAIFATNLLYYASEAASYSHIYGFALLSGVVLLTVHRAEMAGPPSIPSFILFGALLGVAVMVRPTNAVYSLLFLVFIRDTPPSRLVSGVICALLASAVAASPQMVLWFVTTGKPIYYSYAGEGFHFGAPQLFNYLYSIRKGVFFWHPIYGLMLIALLLQWPVRPFEAAMSLLVVILGLYIGASWSDFTFGDSFGSRHSIELIPVMFVPLASAISAALAIPWMFRASAAVIAVLAAINAIHFHGYYKSKLPHNNTDRATYVRFWATFLHITS